jgi:hypothetical protein
MPSVSLALQDPGAVSGYLLEEIVKAAESAERGGGVFAFATAGGIATVLGDRAVLPLLRRGSFDLIVGVDAVTDPRALDELDKRSKQHRGLTAGVLVHGEAVLFHPKLSWFAGPRGLTVIVGSGNLTVRGLRENWEAFAKLELRGVEAARVEKQILEWKHRHEHLLVSPQSAVARAEAKKNTGRESSLKHPKSSPKAKRAHPATADVLVAEAPKSGSRPSQVNFHLNHYEGFFHAKPGSGQRVVLYQVLPSGSVGEPESRPSSSRKSQNFSLELNGFKTLAGRGTDPSIGLYLSLPQGIFLYQRIARGQPGYKQLSAFLAEHWTGRANQKRQVVAKLRDVQKAFPASAIWQVEP